MGYFVKLMESTVELPSKNLSEAFRCFCALEVNYDHLKRGGSYNGGNRTVKWFSWMNDWQEECGDAVETLYHLGFNLEEKADYIRISKYDNKEGQADLFFRSIAHLLNDGSYMLWQGEDDAKWAWIFEDGKMFIATPEKTEEFMPDFNNPQTKTLGA